MYRLLIVDDEYLVRLGLKETIDWSSLGVELVGEASNGHQGFQMAMELQPDVIISDVKMPLVSGTELAKKLNEAHFEGKIIILSGYRDFEYAKETFENGVFSYVLKPVDNAEIIRVVSEALKLLQSERDSEQLYQGLKEQMPVVKHQIFKDILVGNISVEQDIIQKLNLFHFPIIKNGVIILVKADEENPKTPLQITHLKNELLERFRDIDCIDYAFDRYLVLMVRYEKREDLLALLRSSLTAHAEQSSDTFSVGVAFYEGLPSIKEAYLATQKAVSQKLFLGLNTVVDGASNNPAYKKNVLAAMDIISKRYKENLTVKIIADELRVSESYFMHLFKNNLGLTFNDVLTNYRMMVAKNLLSSGRYRINEVADLVGYSDVKYFSLVFRKAVGMTPSAYALESEKKPQ